MPDTLEMPYRPSIWGASKEPIEGYRPYRMGGQTCLAGDFLDAYYFPKPLAIGDTIFLEDMMHYTMVKTNVNYVHHPSIYSQRKRNIECARV